MKKIVLIILILIGYLGFSQAPGTPKISLSNLQPAPTGSVYVIATDLTTGKPTYSLTSAISYTPTLQDVINKSNVINGSLLTTTNGLANINATDLFHSPDEGIKLSYTDRSSNLSQLHIQPGSGIKLDAGLTELTGNLQVDGVIQSPGTNNSATINDGSISLDFNGVTNSAYVSIIDSKAELKHDALVNLYAPSVTKNGEEIATLISPSFTTSTIHNYATPNSVSYFDASKNLKSLILGSGLSLSSGTLTATGTGSTTVLTASTNITVNGTAPNYTVSSPSQSLSISGNTISLSASGGSVTIPTQTTGLLPNTTSLTINGTTKTFTSTPSFTTITLSSLSVTSPLFYNNSTGVFTVQPSSTSQSGVLSSTDWNTFNGKQSALTASTNITINSNTISASSPTITAGSNASVTTSGLSYTIGVASSLTNSVTTNTSDISTLQTSKQNTLVAGANLALSTNTISVSSSPTFTNSTLTSTTVLTGAINHTMAVSVASSSTVNLAAVQGNVVHVTGSTTINNFGTVQAGAQRTLIFDGALTITSNTTSLILPGNSDILTAANDIAVFVSEGSGNWRCVSYLKNDENFVSCSSTITGFSTTPTYTASYKMQTRNTYLFNFHMTATAGSNATTLTITAPFNFPNNSTTIPVATPCWIMDNSTSSIGFFVCTAGSNLITISKVGGAFTAGGTIKAVRISAILISQ